MPLKMKTTCVEENVLFQVGYVQDHPFRFNQLSVSTMNNAQMELTRCGLAGGNVH